MVAAKSPLHCLKDSDGGEGLSNGLPWRVRRLYAKEYADKKIINRL